MTISEFVDRFETRRSGKGWLMKCPAHDDRFPSLSISEGKDGCVLLKCHAGCDLDAILSALGITKKDLFPERMYASNNPKFQRRSEEKPAHDHDRVPFDWQKCVAEFTEEHAEQIARWRGFSTEFVRELREKGWIGIHNGLVAFPVYNDGKIVGTHFRLKDGTWQYFPTGIKAASLVFGKLTSGERVNVFESTWDGLAFMDKSGERDGIIIARGSSNAKLVTSMLPRQVIGYVWPQNDEPNEKFIRDLVDNAMCTLRRVTIPVAHFGSKLISTIGHATARASTT